MKFTVTGTRTRRVILEIEDHLEECEIEVLKKDVLSTLDLPAKVDGDPTHWYGEVEEALKWGCGSEILTDVSERTRNSTERTVKVIDDWQIEHLDW
jgi:hypothetical protein